MAQDLLEPSGRAAVEDASSVYVSAATIWEIEIKRAARRLRAPEDIAKRADDSGYDRLAITFEHATEAGRLPRLHEDPFDRMLIAQARLEGLTLMTADQEIRRYDVRAIDAARA